MELQVNFKESVFEAVGLEEIIWVDDRFSEKSNSLVDEYLNEIAAIHENNDLGIISDFEAFGNINWESPFVVIKDDIPIDDITISAFYKHLNRDVPDLSETQFNNLIKLLEEASDSMFHLSHEQWVNKKADLLKGSKNRLFLIDLNFEKEGLPVDHGESIICELLKLSIQNCYFVLFTSETNVGAEEEAARKSIVDKLDASTDHHHFSVLSKNILDEGDGKVSLDFKSAEFLKRIFLRKLSSEMVDTVKTTLSTSLDALKSILSQNSIYEVDASIFSKSLGEGLSEFDLLHRMFYIKQREEMYKNLTVKPDLIEKLKKFRSVQCAAQNKCEQEYIQKTMSTSQYFISLRDNEMFDYSINLIHSPLLCGDIFQFTDGASTREYILIDQLCDLTVRGSTGERIAKEVLLVPFEVKKRTGSELRDDKVLDKYYMLQKASGEAKKEYYRFDFSGAINVNSYLLDLSVFNTKGSLSFDVKQKDDSLLFLPGWIKRFSRFKSEVIDNGLIRADLPLKYKVFTMLDESRFEVCLTRENISINGCRISRLRSPFIDEIIYSYYAKYKARTAFDIDFS